jgi:hypothetical protein
MVTVLVIIVAAVCCGLCAYGINAAVRRSKARRAQDPQADAPR